ncbi:hypothetical protein BC939DRAFT_445428 [Gamsiella multidivaricata]|uniref:uncharacterized protein n=1 Tax=Gamsiella multidivaricata TaxID=101098 RepID=UPI002220037D|nr:uncharacterized protein BC939DRAFT_445428 [Gamsiella multidivaricata]KAI7827503.1 hypothetical protein BC939DRAFT_445428 [Gamsiella multidivaricata]
MIRSYTTRHPDMPFASMISMRVQTLVRINARAALITNTRVLAGTLARTYSNRTGPSSNSTAKSTDSKALDPNKIKGPGGLTMTQIGRLVRQSHAKDLEHQAKKRDQQSTSKAPKK